MSDTPKTSKSNERLNWLGITGLAAIALAGYFSLYFSVKTMLPGYLEYVITAGHVVITIAVIITIRQIELPTLKKERQAILDRVEAHFEDLLNKYTPLMQSTRDLGLSHIYRNREEAKPHIVQSIQKTHSKLLMIGVAFYEQYSIDQEGTCIRDIIKESGGHIDARFLLLNPHTTAAVLRSFLESKRDDVVKFIDSELVAFRDISKLYSDWKRAVQSFSDECFLDRVRFYRCDPTVWLVITDEHVFVEPYTFGKPDQPHAGDDLRMGGHMPVFEFSPQSSVAAILKDHFERLWAITRDGITNSDKGDIQDLRVLLNDQAAAASKLKHDVFEPRKETLEALRDSLQNGKHHHAAKGHKTAGTEGGHNG
jgi:hypothetical protein